MSRSLHQHHRVVDVVGHDEDLGDSAYVSTRGRDQRRSGGRSQLRSRSRSHYSRRSNSHHRRHGSQDHSHRRHHDSRRSNSHHRRNGSQDHGQRRSRGRSQLRSRSRSHYSRRSNSHHRRHGSQDHSHRRHHYSRRSNSHHRRYGSQDHGSSRHRSRSPYYHRYERSRSRDSHYAVDGHLKSFVGRSGEGDKNYILNQISSRLQQKIWSNKFVDLAKLLPIKPAVQSTSSETYDVQLDHNNLKLTPKSETQKINNIDSWVSAFVRFVAVYTSKPRYAIEAPQLMRYMEVIRDLANRQKGLAFYHYDTQFRTTRASTATSWDHMDLELWAQAATPTPTPSDSNKTNAFRDRRQNTSNKGGPRSASASATSTTEFIRGTCFKYNRDGRCGNTACTFKHVCGLCEGNHSATKCKNPKPQGSPTLQHSASQSATATSR